MDEIKIGKQIWMKRNLDVDTFRNGDAIPQAKTDAEWRRAGEQGKPAWCYYENAGLYGEKYGKLYNWFAVNDLRGLAPEGWHVPSDNEWTTLTTFLGGESVAGGKMKSTGTSLWQSPNTAATNSIGFTALPGGYRNGNGTFNFIGSAGHWWFSSEFNTVNAWGFVVVSSHGSALRGNLNKEVGFSVRCLKD